MLKMFMLSIGGIPIERLPDVNTLPAWLLRQLYIDGAKDWDNLSSKLDTTRKLYRFAHMLWLGSISAFLLFLVVIGAMFAGVPVPSVVGFVLAVFVGFSVVPMLLCGTLILPDKQLWILAALNYELKKLPAPFSNGISSLKGVTENQLEDALDTEMVKLSSLYSQYRDAGKKSEAQIVARRLDRLIQLSIELGTLNHQTEQYHKLKAVVIASEVLP